MAIITISRGTFGGGKAVAETLADQLGCACISREMIIQDAANTFDTPKTDLRNSILEPPGLLGLTGGHNAGNIRLVRAALMDRAQNGPMVYHGYGGHLLLKNIPGLLRVRVIAGMDYRMAHVMDQEKISQDEALDLIRANDKARAAWSKNIWGKQWNDPSLFDLVVNLDRISVKGAVNLIAGTGNLPEFTMDKQGEQKFKNQLVISRIWAGLVENKPTRSVRIKIEAHDGHITLTGNVGSIKLKDAVISITASIAGVQKVFNELSIGGDWLW